MISVIVPNYNYHHYLEKRLSSIIKQGSLIGEIIFLDDSSTDNSIELAEKTLTKSGINYRIVENKKNSGSVYRQWEKGISLAKHDFIWIAEADDSCHEDMIESLYSIISTYENLGLVYCDSSTIDSRGWVTSNSFYRDLYSSIDSNKWIKDYIEAGQNEITQALAVRNTIPNVSGVLFRSTALKSALPIDNRYIFSGDWLTYIKILENWDIGYISRNLNYHRQHKSRVTSSFDSTLTYYREAVNIFNYINNKFQLDQSIIEKSMGNLLNQASITSSLSDEVLKVLKDGFSSELVDRELTKYFNSLSRENLVIKTNLLYRLGRINISKILSRFRKRI